MVETAAVPFPKWESNFEIVWVWPWRGDGYWTGGLGDGEECVFCAESEEDLVSARKAIARNIGSIEIAGSPVEIELPALLNEIEARFSRLAGVLCLQANGMSAWKVKRP